MNLLCESTVDISLCLLHPLHSPRSLQPLYPLHMVNLLSEFTLEIYSVNLLRNVPTIIYHYSTVSTGSIGLTFLHQRHCPHHHIPLIHYVLHIHWFDIFAPKTMSPLPYTTISLCLLHPLCPLHPLHPLSTVSTASTVSSAYFVHCIQCMGRVDLFALKVMSPPPIFYCIHCMAHCMS